MKKKIILNQQKLMNTFKTLILFLIILMSFSCEDQLGVNLYPPNPPNPGIPQPMPQLPTASYLKSSNVRSIFSNEIATQLYNSTPYIGTFQNYIYFNYERFLRDELEILQPKLGISGFNIVDLADQFIITTSSTATHVLPSQVAGATGQYSYGQLAIMDSYSTNMYNATSSTDVILNYSMAKNQIINSNLSNNEKIFLMSVIETGNEFGKRFFNGEWNGVYESLKTASGNQGGCSVDWRSVWGGAIVGGVANGIKGAVLGATGGTMTLPGFGTVTGGVAGGVFGFASGFVGGGVASVASNLLLTCFRKSYTTQPLSFSDCMSNQGSLQSCSGPSIPGSISILEETVDKKVWFVLQ